MLGEYINFYFIGYIAALRTVSSLGFTYSFDKEKKVFSQFNFVDNIMNTITLDSLKEILQDQSKKYPEFVDIISRVEKYFDVK